jgi:hypothetical protein
VRRLLRAAAETWESIAQPLRGAISVCIAISAWGMRPTSPYINKNVIARNKLVGPRVRY